MPINHLHPRLCCTPLVDWTDINKDELHRGWPEILSLHIKESVPPPLQLQVLTYLALWGIQEQLVPHVFFLSYFSSTEGLSLCSCSRSLSKEGWMDGSTSTTAP